MITIKNFFTSFAAFCLIISGCQSGNKNVDATATKDSMTATTELAPLQKQPVQNELDDPDTTDTIPVSAYGINTYGKQTVELFKSKARGYV
jgi:hypothetical protein